MQIQPVSYNAPLNSKVMMIDFKYLFCGLNLIANNCQGKNNIEADILGNTICLFILTST